MSDDKKINYVIGRYWGKNTEEIGAYMIHNNQVFSGTLERAEKDLDYVRFHSPRENWKIFTLHELGETSSVVPTLTKEQAIIIMGYTGVTCCAFADFHEDVEKRFGRSVMTHEFGSDIVRDKIRLAYQEDFLKLCPE